MFSEIAWVFYQNTTSNLYLSFVFIVVPVHYDCKRCPWLFRAIEKSRLWRARRVSEAGWRKRSLWRTRLVSEVS